MERTITLELDFATVTIRITKIGEDFQVTVWGGDKPHIGCTVLAVPRTSLTGSGQVSCTSSVLNVTGHKDEAVCRYLAEQIAVKEEAVVVCSGGIHIDGITKEQITLLMKKIKETI